MSGIGAAVAAAAAAVAAGYAAYRSNREQMHAQNHQNKLLRGDVERNERTQREFAEQGIRMRVKDAKAAGLHPLYALGASTPTFTPSSVVGAPVADDAGWKAIAEHGQDVARPFMATRTQQEREIAALNLAGAQADLEGKQIENRIRLHELQKLQLGKPAFPGTAETFIEGQANSGLNIKTKPMERQASYPGRPDMEAGAKTGTGFYVTPDGGLVPVPSKDTKESIEDNMYHETMHFLRNNVMPNFGGGGAPPGHYWDSSAQAYRPLGDWKKKFSPQQSEPDRPPKRRKPKYKYYGEDRFNNR